MKFALLAAALPALVSAVALEPRKVNYDGHKVVRVKTSAKVNKLINDNNIPTWTGRPENTEYADIVLAPGNTLFDNIKTEVMHEDLGKSIAAEAEFQPLAAAAADITWFNSYHAYADHNTFLSDLQKANAARSEIFSVGNSLQGRSIQGIHFWGSAGKAAKPAVILHGNVHAREWITSMTVEYLAWSLLSNYTSSAEVKALVDKYDFYIIPVVNPDGFVYTQTTERLWRKNRQTTSGSTCLGHDINRNWNYQWAATGGASTNPCAEDFKGPSAASAPETKVLAAFSDKIAAAQGLQLYIDYHSYSQLLMSPYGYTCSKTHPNNAAYLRLEAGAVAAIKAVYGTSFTYGPICTTIYPATGGSVDYNSEVSKAKWSLTFELRDTGRYGFVLPANQILPSGVEAFAGFKYLINNI